MIIAMEAEELLLELGCAGCHASSSVDGALQIIDEHSIDFALLDIDLGSETSEAVALALLRQGTPFIFASGYGNFPEFDPRLSDTPVVMKPYTGEDIVAALATLGLG